MTARLEAVFFVCVCAFSLKREKKCKRREVSKKGQRVYSLPRFQTHERGQKKKLRLTEGVGRGPVLEHLVRLEPLGDVGRPGLRRHRREQDPGDGRHCDAAVDELRVREPLEDLRVGAEAERVEAVVAGEGAIEVGRGGVSWRSVKWFLRGGGRKKWKRLGK